MAGGIHERREADALTLVATGRSVDASVKSGGAAGSVRKKRRQTAAMAQSRKRTQRMKVFPAGPAPPSDGSGFAAAGFPAGGSSPFSLLLLHCSSGGRRGAAGAPPLGG
jgi:hypothetical protein